MQDISSRSSQSDGGLRAKVLRAFRPQAHGWHWRGLSALVLLASLGLTTAFWHRERDEGRRVQHEAFDAALGDASQQLLLRMAAQEHLLQGVQGLMAATPLLDAAALRRYVDALPLGADFAGLQGIALAQRGGTAARPTVLLQQIEPAAVRNGAAVGSDLWAQPLLRQALIQAEGSGRMALSAKLNLRELQLGAQPGFVMVLPVYGPAPPSDQSPGAVPTRRAALQAWVVAPLVAPDLMASLYGNLPRGLALTLYDGQQLTDAAVLYRSANSGRVNAHPPQQQAHEYLVIGGHTWTLALQASSDFAVREGVEMHGAVLAVGGAFSLLLALLAGLLGTARERAQALAERMTQALRESEQRWSFALEGAGDGVWDMQPKTGAISSSARWKTLMGWPPERHEPTLTQLRARIHPEDRSRAQVEFQRCLDGFSGKLISEYRVAAANNHDVHTDSHADSHADWNWVLARGTVVERDSKQRPLRMIGTLSDINARRHSEERVRFMALNDPLTELANRAHFDERMHFALANARRHNERIGLILLDLDRFKPVNDHFGHAVGDQLLQTVARRIKGAVRETDTVGRIGGDEFVVLLTGPVSRETARVVADKIFNQVALPMELSGIQIEITCSLGLAIYPDDGADELSLTKAADDAMYADKRAGRHVLGAMGDLTNP